MMILKRVLQRNYLESVINTIMNYEAMTSKEQSQELLNLKQQDNQQILYVLNINFQK